MIFNVLLLHCSIDIVDSLCGGGCDGLAISSAMSKKILILKNKEEAKTKILLNEVNLNGKFKVC